MRTNFSKSELEADADYARNHEECGLKLHGGFDESGQYQSPRTLHRWDAISAWEQQLTSKGVELVEATTELLTEPNYPNVDQQLYLLSQGVEQPLWDSLTITGLIEARGKALAEFTAPDFQEIIVEDITDTGLGHLNKGLLTSHGWDEGGLPGSGLGGHDLMWFAARDLIFGEGRFPIAQPPASIGREKDGREMTQIPEAHEMLISFLMNLLMIEVRAERAFRFYEDVIGDESVFKDKRAEAVKAVEMINRIRLDESVHVAWLKVAISEFRSSTIKTNDGQVVSGAEILDPVWQQMVHWHAVLMHEANRENNITNLHNKIRSAVDDEEKATQVIAEMDRLAG